MHRFVGQPILAAAGFQPALFGGGKRSPAPKTPPERRLQTRLPATQNRHDFGRTTLGNLRRTPIGARPTGFNHAIRAPGPVPGLTGCYYVNQGHSSIRYTVVLEREADGGYVATVPALPGHQRGTGSCATIVHGESRSLITCVWTSGRHFSSLHAKSWSCSQAIRSKGHIGCHRRV